MLHNTKGIVLRSVKYGETSLVSTIFTKQQGIQTYMVQGVRTGKIRSNKAALLQPATLLDMVVYHKPQAGLQRIKEFQYAYLYISLQEDVVKNSIALFSVELLFRLLPDQAQQPDLFEFSFDYFRQLDQMPAEAIGNFPIFFLIQCGHMLGYEIMGTYTEQTQHLNLQDGAFTDHLPEAGAYLEAEETQLLSALLQTKTMGELNQIRLNASTRFRLMDWYLAFLHQHTQHLGTIKSLAVLQAVLH